LIANVEISQRNEWIKKQRREREKQRRRLHAAQNDEDYFSSDEDDEDKDARLISELTGDAKPVTETKTVQDEFSKEMFGSSTVTVTTTKLKTDDDDSKAVKDSYVPILGTKFQTHVPGRAEQMLERMKSKQAFKSLPKRKKKNKRRKGGKTTAKERRKRH